MVKGGRKKAVAGNWELKLEKDELGFVFLKEGYTESGVLKKYEIAECDKIENQIQILHDPLRNKTKKENRTVFSIKNETYFTNNDVEIKNLLHKAKRVGSYIYRKEEEEFVNSVKGIDLKEINLTNAVGFGGGKYLDYPEFTIYQLNIINKNGTLSKSIEYVAPEDSYLEFMNLEPDPKIVEKIKEIINTKFWRSVEEKKSIKKIFSFSISSRCKIALVKKGIKLHPIFIVIGPRRLGKSTTCTTFFSKLWNTPTLEPEHFEGARGARIKQLMPVVSCLHVDELENIESYKDTLKNSTISGILKIPKGRKDGGIELIEKPFNLIISCNKFQTSDAAFKDRIFSENYTHEYEENKVTDKEMVWLHDNMIHLGKYIYNKLSELNVSGKIDELSSVYKTRFKDRDLYKIIYIKLGEKILDELGILDDIKIEPEEIVHTSNDITVSIDDQVQDIIRGVINNITNKETYDGATSIQTVGSCIEKKELTESMFNLMASKGVHIGHGFKSIIIGNNIVSLINERLGKLGITAIYKGLKDLSVDLNKKGEFKTHSIQTGDLQNNSTKRGIKFEISEVFGNE